MFTDILTWAGAILGVALLAIMAFGSVAMDFEIKWPKSWHRRSRRDKHAPQG